MKRRFFQRVGEEAVFIGKAPFLGRRLLLRSIIANLIWKVCMDIETIDSKLRASLLTTATIAVIAVVSYVGWFGILIDLPASHTPSTWGEFGDFVGGVMNPIVAACALYWLTMSVRLQKLELKAARDELALTRNELATSSAAQQEQARLALLGTRINSLTIQINATSLELGSVETRISYLLRQMDERGLEARVHEPGYVYPTSAFQIAEGLKTKAKVLSDRQTALMAELELINSLTIAKQVETAQAPLPT